jgi:predicted DCC family thiol-disulfide oxidoreductase YuxK
MLDQQTLTELYYDGECRFCKRAVEWLRMQDAQSRRLAFFDATKHESLLRLKGLVGEIPDVSRAMWAIRNRELYEGYDAFRVALAQLPQTRLLGSVMAFPLVRFPGMLVYRLVASNRHKLGCSVKE